MLAEITLRLQDTPAMQNDEGNDGAKWHFSKGSHVA
jgi:hypothetical protein